ncbi:MAG: hypothetical protein ASARMPREDX12_000118 [Alectoria sarmentosa]|nr:MAG: hypothetical protein ASARMPREDX12_000118 [Alectoria sarmentosa]
MTVQVPKTGFIELDQGQLFWKYDSPVHDKDRVKSGPSPRPVLLFIHAWDEQVVYSTARGWSTLRFDLLGYGQSIPSESYVQRGCTPAVKHHDHAVEVIEQYRLFRGHAAIDEKFVMIGLSRGASYAVDFALQFPHLTAGLVVCAGGLGGFDFANTNQEIAMFECHDDYVAKGDAHNAAMMDVTIWGRGSQGNDGRLSKMVGDKLYEWCKLIAQREIAGTGGSAIPAQDLTPKAAERLSDINVPTAVAFGRYDDTSTNETMKYVAQHIPGAKLTEFGTAHMINLECPSEFNDWLGAYLDHSLI